MRKFMADTDAVIKMYKKAIIFTNDTTINYGQFNPDQIYGKLIMNKHIVTYS